MTDSHTNTTLTEFFTPGEDLDDDGFTTGVMNRVDNKQRWFTRQRIALGLVLAFVSVPLDQIAIQASLLLTTTVIPIESTLVAQLLAPLNMVGSLLSLALLGVRGGYKRLFHKNYG